MGITEVTGMEALLIALSGILVVFMMLAVLSIMITLISKLIPGEKTAKSETAGASAEEAAPAGVEAAPLDVPYGGTIKLLDVDEKTAACVMAIVSHETKIPLDQLVFKSIRLLKE